MDTFDLSQTNSVTRKTKTKKSKRTKRPSNSYDAKLDTAEARVQALQARLVCSEAELRSRTDELENIKFALNHQNKRPCPNPSQKTNRNIKLQSSGVVTPVNSNLGRSLLKQKESQIREGQLLSENEELKRAIEKHGEEMAKVCEECNTRIKNTVTREALLRQEMQRKLIAAQTQLDKLRQETSREQREREKMEEQINQLQRKHQHVLSKKNEHDKKLNDLYQRNGELQQVLEARETSAGQGQIQIADLSERLRVLRMRNGHLEKILKTEVQAKESALAEVRILEEECQMMMDILQQKMDVSNEILGTTENPVKNTSFWEDRKPQQNKSFEKKVSIATDQQDTFRKEQTQQQQYFQPQQQRQQYRQQAHQNSQYSQLHKQGSQLSEQNLAQKNSSEKDLLEISEQNLRLLQKSESDQLWRIQSEIEHDQFLTDINKLEKEIPTDDRVLRRVLSHPIKRSPSGSTD